VRPLAFTTSLPGESQVTLDTRREHHRSYCLEMADETSASGAKLGNSVASPPTHPAKAPMSQPSSNHTPATSTSSEGPRPAPTVSFDPSTKSKERATGVDGSASSRRSSVSSIRFSDAPRHPELPRRGNRTQFDHRHRAASPPAKR